MAKAEKKTAHHKRTSCSKSNKLQREINALPHFFPDVPTSTMKSIDSTSNHVTTNEESTQTATDAVEQTVGGLAVWKYTCPIIDFLHNNFPYSIVAVLKVIKRFH